MGKLILTIRTDKLEAELGLYDSQKELAYTKWQANRWLADTIHKEIKKILNKLSISLGQVEGIVVYKGPGSFTGLRIGISVANALAYSLDIPVVGKSGQKWLTQGISDILADKNDKIALPKYDSPAKTTTPRK